MVRMVAGASCTASSALFLTGGGGGAEGAGGGEEGSKFREMRKRIIRERAEANRLVCDLCGPEVARNVYFIPPRPGDVASKKYYLLATVHFTEESKRQVRKLVKMFRFSMRRSRHKNLSRN